MDYASSHFGTANQFQQTFPKSETTLINGAVPATGSDYFAMCFAEHIDKDVDLVILEIAINDQRSVLRSRTIQLILLFYCPTTTHRGYSNVYPYYRYDKFAEANEWLLRALLDLPKRPAILNLQTMALMFDQITTGGDLHIGLMNYYGESVVPTPPEREPGELRLRATVDIPSVSIRNPLLPQIFAHPELVDKWYSHSGDGDVDLRHVSISASPTAFATFREKEEEHSA